MKGVTTYFIHTLMYTLSLISLLRRLGSRKTFYIVSKSETVNII